jgi:ATP-dependent Clp protease, protease subunit
MAETGIRSLQGVRVGALAFGTDQPRSILLKNPTNVGAADSPVRGRRTDAARAAGYRRGTVGRGARAMDLRMNHEHPGPDRGPVPGDPTPPEPRRWPEPNRRGSPPDQPGAVPPGPPQPGGVAPWLEERLFDQRIVLLSGPLTAESATRTAATLLTLDAVNGQPVRLHVAAAEGDLTAAFAIVDTLDLMRSPVVAIATAEVGGAALAVYAAGRRRLAYPHARFRLNEPRVSNLTGTADQVASAAGRYLQALEDLVLRVVDVTGRPRSRVEDDFSAGLLLTATEACEYGLVEEVVKPNR